MFLDCVLNPELTSFERVSISKLVKTDKLFSRKPKLLEWCLRLQCFFPFLEDSTKETINSQYVPSLKEEAQRSS